MVNDKYGYAIGRIRALETKMLDEARLVRMADAHDFQSAFSVLNETAYAGHMQQMEHPFDFEELIEMEMTETRKFLRSMAGGSQDMKELLEGSLRSSKDPFLKEIIKMSGDNKKKKLAMRKEGAATTSNAAEEEKAMDDRLIDLVKRGRYMSFGIHPLLAFWMAKMIEVKDLRFVLVCKKNGVGTEEIKKRIRRTYV
ncbi:MAG: V-type ATPase subunit [Candidatus Margulisiibacteriota bacterium]|nr:V-type ATPase subunit [Candidatus Margulisiibacteriota bacterium]